MHGVCSSGITPRGKPCFQGRNIVFLKFLRRGSQRLSPQPVTPHHPQNSNYPQNTWGLARPPRIPRTKTLGPCPRRKTSRGFAEASKSALKTKPPQKLTSQIPQLPNSVPTAPKLVCPCTAPRRPSNPKCPKPLKQPHGTTCWGTLLPTAPRAWPLALAGSCCPFWPATVPNDLGALDLEAHLQG